MGRTDVVRASPSTSPPRRSAGRTAAVTAAIVLALYALSGVYVVGGGERGLVTRLGRLAADDVAPGVRYHAPWPFERVESLRLRVVETAEADGGAPRGARRLEFLTGDRNLVEAGVAVEYEVTDPVAAVALAGDAPLVVRRLAESALADAVGRTTLDDVLGQRAAAVESRAAAQVQGKLDALRAGIRVVAVRLEGACLAGHAAAAHARLGEAIAARHTATRAAEAYRARIEGLAAGESAALLASVNRHRARVVSEAEGEAARFTALLAEYRSNPGAVRDRLYRETMQDALGRVRTRVVDAAVSDTAGAAAPGE